MHPAKWLLRPLGLRLVTPVGVSNKTTTSARSHTQLLPAGRWRQSKTSSRRDSLLPNVRGAASQIGCPPSPMSKPSMHPASFIAARSRPTTPLGSVSGSPESTRAKDCCLLRLLASRRRRLLLRSRRPGQLQPSKMSTQKSKEPTSCSPVWPMTGAAVANSPEK